MKPDTIATIRFLTSEEGGRKFNIPFEHNGQFHDCRLLLAAFGSIAPGKTVKRVPIVFFNPDEVLKRLSVGDVFTLWEAGTKAEGTVPQH